jgi:carboxymethylenebutenolidase
MPHAFFNSDRPAVYNEEAAEDAWQRTVRFFELHLNRA